MEGSGRVSEISDLAISFEAKKVSVNQNKDGIILRLSIHPNECPTQIWKDWVGTRYGVVMVQIGDDEQPTAHDDVLIANKAIASAGMLCRSQDFNVFLHRNGLAQLVELKTAEDEARLAEENALSLRKYLGIESRKDFRTNREALEKFLRLRDDYFVEPHDEQ
jgi:hypothetical protein